MKNNLTSFHYLIVVEKPQTHSRRYLDRQVPEMGENYRWVLLSRDGTHHEVYAYCLECPSGGSTEYPIHTLTYAITHLPPPTTPFQKRKFQDDSVCT
jgi:hypothetical protein